MTVEDNIRLEDHDDMPNGTPIIANTFWQDFSIADKFGAGAVEDTYKRAFKAFKKDIRYMTALAITLNHKIWAWYEHDDKLARTYDKLWKEIDQFILDCENAGEDGEEYKNFTAEEVGYFIRATD